MNIYIQRYTYKNMPEGPEVKIMTDNLNTMMRGKCLQSIRIISGPYQTHPKPIWKKTRDRVDTIMRTLLDKNRAICIASVKNKGKFIYFNLIHLERQPKTDESSKIVEKGRVVLGSSLGLKGHWVANDQTQAPLHARIEITYSNKPVVKGDLYTLWYDDTMSQGKFNIETPEWLDKKLKTLGPDVLGDATSDMFIEKMKTKKAQKMKLFESLMEQNLVSGIGNYLRAEILYHVQENLNISPFLLVSALSDNQLKNVWTSIQKTAKWIVSKGGTSLATYSSGLYEPQIYKKDVAPNGRPIITIKDKNGRMFYYT